MTLILDLIRHTPVAVGSELCIGRGDVPLAETAPNDFEQVISRLEHSRSPLLNTVSPQNRWVYSSPQSRCVQLAKGKVLPWSHSAQPFQTEPAIQELDVGRWDQVPWDKIPEAELQAWNADMVNVPCPDGESFQALFDRVLECFEGLQDQYFEAGEDIYCCWVTHASVIRALMAYVLGIPLTQAFSLKIDPGHLSRVSLTNGKLLVDFVNR